jgi:ankyrin repeat protein
MKMAKAKSIPHQLSDAVDSGDMEAFARLLRDHPEHVWDRQPGYTRWLFAAADAGQLPILELLVAAGADVNAPKASGAPEGVIDAAAGAGHLEVVHWLLDQGAIINHSVGVEKRCFALTNAAFQGRLEVVKLLVERGAWINCVWAESTPLAHAIGYGETEVADYLRSVGAKLPDELP